MADAALVAASWRPRHSPWLITLSVLLATFMEVLDTSVANVALPHIAGSMSVTVDESTWVLTSYLVSNAIILSATAWFSRLVGRKRYLAFSVALFTISSALCGMAHSLPQLVVARVLQGLGGGGLQPLSQAIMLESFEPEERGAAMAAYGMGVVVAPIIGPTLGGWITDNYSWRWIFYINLPVGIAGLILQQLFVEDPPYIRRTAPPIVDFIGFGLMAVGIGALQVVLDKGQDLDWFASTAIRAGVAVSAITLVAFVIWELSHEHPIVNLRVLKNRNFATATLLMAMLGGILYGTTALLPIFMQTLLGYTAYAAGWAMTPRGIGSFISMIIIGRIIRHVDGRLMIAFGFVGVCVTCWILSHLNLETTQANISWPLVLNGLSLGFIFVPMTTLSVSTLRQEEIYQATGIYSLMRNIGASIGISIIVALQARVTQTHQALLSAHMTPDNPSFTGRMRMITAYMGTFPARDPARSAYGVLLGILHRQASLLAFMDAFRWLALVCAVVCPLVLLFEKGRPASAANGTAAH